MLTSTPTFGISSISTKSRGEEQYSRNTELRHLKPKSVFVLSSILEQNEGWKSLMAVIPSDVENFNSPLKYSTEDMRLIEDAGLKQNRPCTEILFEEWGTSGRKRPTLHTLLECLLVAELYRSAEFVATKLLKEPVPPRPNDGPAARVEIEDIEKTGLTFLSLNEEDACIDDYKKLEGSDTGSSFQYKTTACVEQKENHPESYSDTETDDSVTFNLESIVTVNRIDAVTRKIESDDHEGVTVALRNSEVVDQKDGILENDNDACRYLSYRMLQRATSNFDKDFILGSGAFGDVYYGEIDKKKLAIKVLRNTEEAAVLIKQFESEVQILSRCQHQNILPLYAVSVDNVPCVIYEYMPNGTLEDRIACKLPFPPLSWKERIQISCGIAEGLSYLHFGMEKPIIHRDIKSANVLLDESDVPKIGDFGLVRATNVSRHTIMTDTVIGTTAYMSPEAFRGDVSVQMDTYSFGVLLLELITGLPPYDEDRDGTDIVTFVDTVDDDLKDLADPAAGEWSSEALDKFVEICESCLLEKKRRPRSKDISSQLQLLLTHFNG